ncbi:MAG: DUF1569 domain-containing protein [Bryobacteraceae bacterium]|nr:DUF1569 domain-containing protein [Bryobacteraceae bacterium]
MRTLSDPDIRTSVIERVKTLRPGSKAVWGQMNVHQMICHLSDSFRAALGEKVASPAAGWASRNLLKWMALYLPMPWPRGIKTRPEMEQGVGGTCPTDFGEDRRKLLHLLDRFSRPGDELGRFTHPLFGSMSVKEWRRWGYLHMDHHLRQFGA